MNLIEYQQALQTSEGEAKVITLCGSTKFEAEFAEVNQRLTMDGCVVISLGMFSLPDLPDYNWTADSSDLKGRLGGVGALLLPPRFILGQDIELVLQDGQPAKPLSANPGVCGPEHPEVQFRFDQR
ncbi:MAG: hypothetical protein L0H93_23470 [Nocardioides sp.]|nr:hypothetical protein [Nocardioides sp.]